MTDLKKITTGYTISQHPEPCIGKDPRCPCQDGDACHYKDCGGTKALPVAQRKWVGLTDEDMKDPQTHILDFIYGARWAEAKLKERNT